MLAVLGDLVLALRLPRGDAVAICGRLAPRYDRLHRRWLRAGGAETAAAPQGCLAAELRPGARVLDARCGTGALARWIAGQQPRASVTLLDASPSMLERAAELPGRRVRGDIHALPLADLAFDIVTCAWALETVADPARALAVERVFGGRFLDPDFGTGLARDRTRRMPYHRGLSTLVCHRSPRPTARA